MEGRNVKRKRYVYRFNPHTLSYERVEATWRDKLRRAVTTVLPGVVAGIGVAFALGSLVGSPEERMLRAEVREYRAALETLNSDVSQAQRVLADIEERDSAVYRTIFGAKPVAEGRRRPLAGDYSRWEGKASGALIAGTVQKVEELEQRLYSQSLSLDEIYRMAGTKRERMARMPAIMPIAKQSCRMVSGFGMRYHPILHYRRMHTGVDLSAQPGTPVHATAEGRVTTAGRGEGLGGYGICVVVDHGYGFKTLYAHLQDVKVSTGQRVSRGTVVGTVGRTGLAQGYHLHYEVIQNGQKVNPVYYFFNDLTPEEYDEVLEASYSENQCLS